MEWLNYHHLLYFYTVAREGSVSKAAEKLFLTQPTLSSQIKALERSLGEKLFQKSGRNLKLTEIGEATFRYSEEIFDLGKELSEMIKGKVAVRSPELRIGLSDAVSKIVARQLLLPVIHNFPDLKIICQEEKTDALFLQLAANKYDVLITDSPLRTGSMVKAFSHLLGDSGMSILGLPSLVKKMKLGFPKSMDGKNFLMPLSGVPLRRSIDAWLNLEGVQPKIVGEFEDTALIKVFANKGIGLCFVPQWVEAEVKKQFGLETLGRADSVRESYYIISPERKIKHPAVSLLCNEGKNAFSFA